MEYAKYFATGKQFIEAQMMGFIGYLAKIGFTFIFFELVGLNYLLAYLISLLILGLGYFQINREIIFKSKKTKLSKYFIAYSIFMLLDVTLVKTITDFLGAQYILSITISSIIITVLKFVIYKYIIFKK